MKVYGFWRSQAMFRLRVALNLKGIAYIETPINIDRGEQDADWFRQINPMGSVPALMVDGTPLTQSLAILEYLEEVHPQPALLPTDPKGRARVRSLASLIVSDAHPLIVPRVKKYLAEYAGFDAERWKDWQTNWFSTALVGFEARIARSPETSVFCHGNAPSFADICLVGIYAGAKTFKIDVADIPTVDRIVETCCKIKAFDDGRAEKQADFPG